MGKKKIGLVLALDGEKEVAQGFQNIKKEASHVKAELTDVSKKFSDNANSMEALKAKQEALTKAQEVYQRKLDTAKNGLKAAQNVYKEQDEELQKLRKSLEEAKKAQEQMAKSGDTSSDAYKKQVEKVDKLQHQVNQQSTATIKASGSISDWNGKVASSQRELDNCNKELDKNAQYLKEAEAATDGCTTSIDKFGKAVKETGEITTTLKDKIGNALVTKGTSMAVDALKDGVEKVKESMYDISSASSELAAKTGLSSEAMQKYRDVMYQIKGDNFGEDYGDVADTMAEIIQIMGELDENGMKNVTESAITLRDTFNMDVNESIRAADVMMKTMGVDAEEAFDLIVTGAQNGLNRSGELTDNLIEYASLWGQAGFSAEEMFAILENGLDSGAYNLDKVNDYVKEFGVSLSDGRVEKNLSSFSDKTQNLFQQWKSGNASTSDVFYSVINDLSEMTNQQEALTLASEVWSALGEDNAMQVLTALDDVNDKYKDVKGAMEDLKEVRYNDLESAVSGLGSAIQKNLITPIADAALPAVTGAFEKATEVIEGIGSAINQPKSDIEQFVDDIKASNDEIQGMLDNATQILNDADVDVSKLEIYKQTITEINDLEDASGLQKYELQQAVNDLAGDIPELAAAWDSETERINLSKDAIEALIDQQIAYKKETAASLALQETYNAKIAAEANQLKIDSSVEDLQKRIEALKELNKATDDFQNGGYGDYYKDLIDLEAEMTDLTKEQKKAAEAAQEAGKQYDDLQDYVEKSTAAEEKAKQKVAEHADELNELTGTVQNAVPSINEAASAVAEVGVNLMQTSDEMGKFATSTAESSKAAAEAAKDGAEAQKDAMRSILDTYHGYVSEIESDLQNKISVADKFEAGEAINSQTMIDNLHSSVEGLTEYKENLQRLVNEVGDEIAPEFMQYLMEMGQESPELINNLVDAIDAGYGVDRLKEMSREYMEAMDLTEDIAEIQAANKVALEAATGELGSSEYDFSDLRDAIDTAVSSAAEGWEGLPEATEAALEQTIQTAQDCGIKIPEGLAEGIASGETSPEEAIAQLKGSIQGMFEGLSEMAKEAGVDIDEDAMSELAAGIESGGQAAVDAYSQLVELIAGKSPELQQAIEEGAKTDGMKTSMESTVESGLEVIEGATPEYQAGGQQLGEAYAEGLLSTEKIANNSGKALSEAAVKAIKDQLHQMQAAGRQQAQAYVDAINACRAQSLAAGQALAAAAKSGASLGTAGFSSVGYNMSAGVASGISSGQSLAVNAAINMARNALAATKKELDIHSPSRKFRKQVGQNISESTAFGIADKASLAGKEAAKMSKKVYTNATAWLTKYKKTHKTSLADEKYYWEKVSDHVKKGTAAYASAQKKINQINKSLVGKSLTSKISKNFGVSDTKTTGSGSNKKTERKSDDKYYSEIFTAAKKALDNYQASHKMSLDQEEAYWEQVKKKLKKGTQGWYDAQKQLKKVRQEIAAEQAKYYQNLLDNTEAKNAKLDLQSKKNVENLVKNAQEELKNWQDALKKLKKGTDEYTEAQNNIIDAYDGIVSAAQQYISNQRILGTMSLGQELEYWENIQKTLKEGTQAWYDAQSEINDLRESIADAAADAAEEAAQAAEDAAQKAKDRITETANVQNSLLSKYKTYYKMSAKAEMEYWEIAREQFAQGTDERIEADEKYLEAKEEYYEQLAELEEEYAENSKSINDELADSIKELQDAYDDAVSSRQREIMSSMNLFESWDAGGYTKDVLTQNLKTQVEGLKFWEQQLEELGKKNVSRELLDELAEMGPEAAANIWSLNQMTAEELEEYNAMWTEKNNLARKQALKDNGDLLKDTEDKIAEARKAAQEELTALKSDYDAAVLELNTGLSDGLRSLVDQAASIGEEIVSSLIGALTSDKSKEEINSAVSGIINSYQEQQTVQTPAASQPAPTTSQPTTPQPAPAQTTPQQTAQAIVEAQIAKDKAQGLQAIKVDPILAIIQANKSRPKTLTASEKKEKSDLWQYIVKKYGRSPATGTAKKLADELGIKVGKDVSSAEKTKILKKLKEKGYATGKKRFEEDGSYWLHDGEMIVRKSDNGRLKTLNAGDGVIPANLTANLMEWGKQTPQEYLAKARAALQSQQATLRQQMDLIDSSGIARLNRMTEQYQPQPTVVNVDNSALASLMETLITAVNGLSEKMDNQKIIMDTGALVGAIQPTMSKENAAATIRRNRGRR